MFSVNVPSTPFVEIPMYTDSDNPFSGVKAGKKEGMLYIRASSISAVVVGNDGFAHILWGNSSTSAFKVKAEYAMKILENIGYATMDELD